MQRRKNHPIRWVAWGALGACAAAGAFAAIGHAHPGPPPQRDMPVTDAVRKQAIDAAIANLEQAYVFPDKAEAMARRLRQMQQSGEFDKVTSSERFAETLTDVLQRESHDPHIEVRYFEQPVPIEPPGKATDEASPHERIEQIRMNYGVASVGRLHGNLGYIDLHQLGRPEGAVPRYAAAMRLLADTAALVIDLRQCGGGDPDAVMAFASYLFDRPTHLNDIYWRAENRTQVRWTQPNVPGPRYGERRRVYVLTSQDTFSGCEDLAYALKNARRATLVGETTGGGAHAGDPHRLAEHFMMFVPAGRPISPVTHTDWEGVGVTPDVQTSAAKSLDAAQRLALTALIANEHDADWKARLQDAERDL